MKTHAMRVVEGAAGYYTAEREYADVLRAVGLGDALSVFEHASIRPWRRVRERENCTLDSLLPDGRSIRLHVKRFHPSRFDPARDEAAGIRLLQQAGIATTPLVAHGRLRDGRGFLITEDLAGFLPADRAIAGGLPFDALLGPAADLAAALHQASLHHRDLYLCHFFVRADGDRVAELRLIDAARVRRLPRWFAQRWIVKDLAQFWFSTFSAGVSEAQRDAWFDRYVARRDVAQPATLRSKVRRKAAWIERHDRSLRQSNPERDVSLRH
jgi:hypothetical protein